MSKFSYAPPDSTHANTTIHLFCNTHRRSTFNGVQKSGRQVEAQHTRFPTAAMLGREIKENNSSLGERYDIGSTEEQGGCP